MKNLRKQFVCVIDSSKGSVLLVSLLIMGVLMVITLGLSDLIIREIRIQADVTKAGQAYYAAEAGIEKGLYEVRQGLPGIERSFEDTESMLKGDIAKFAYSVIGKASSIPSIDDKFFDVDSFADLDAAKFTPLKLNESVNIPLFVEENGEAKKVDSFYVAFYMEPFKLNIEESKKLKSNSGNLDLNDVDVLRWKIFGLRQDAQFRTESISDFISASTHNTSVTPRCFGTDIDTSECSAIGNPSKADARVWELENLDDGVVSEFELPSVCDMTQARVYYNYLPDGELLGVNKDCPSVKDFIVNHSYNYLTLTNSANPLMIKNNGVGDEVASLAERDALSTIYYKVIALDGGKLPLDQVELKSRGEVGGLQQDIQVIVGRDQFLPVFNFSLYRFDADK